MPKNKRPVPRKSSVEVEDDVDVMAQALADLALELVEREDGDAEQWQQKEEAFKRMVRNALRKKNDEMLYGAIERAKYDDVEAWQYLRGHVEEAGATMMIRRDGKPTEEINAFLVPLFVHSTGGLKQDATFQDVPAFELLRASFQQDGLESDAASVVLISHAYDLAEIDNISYSALNDMLREVAATMSEKKKVIETPALAASISGWAGGAFAPADQAMELRFLLGFTRKNEGDPFYLVPDDEAGADAYFANRMARYRQWTLAAAPLLQSCLAADPTSVSINFLYQDLFYGAKEQGMAELAMLEMMSGINQALEQHQLASSQVSAIVAPADVDDQMVLRVNLYRAGEGNVSLASHEKPFDLAADLQTEVDDICDALATIGIDAVSVALKFGSDGTAQEMRPYHPEPL